MQVPGPVVTPRPDAKGGGSSGDVNIWSGRRVGPRAAREERVRAPSHYRCHPVTDTGRTRGSEGQVNTFCLYFAK